MTYGTIVVGTDGSSTAEEAVRHAASLAATDGARLVVVTAYTPHQDEVLRRSEGEAPEDIRWMLTDRSLAEEKARHGRELSLEAGATGVVVQATEGSPADVILDAAKQFGADLIVVGSKGLTSASRYVLGAVASSVSHHAPCDVLVVHTA